MTDPELAAAISRMIFDEPARIPLAEFVKAYDQHRSVERHTAQFVALRALFPDDATAIVVAVQQARDHRFFFPLWTTLLERLSAALQHDPDAQQITEAVAASVGTMQQVLQAQGFRRVASWPGLFKAARVTGLVRVDVGGGPPASGTGFLVGADLLLTAAHVVAGVLDTDVPRPGSADRIVVRFHNQLESSGAWPIECRVAADWLVALSPPLGLPPDLGSTESPNAAQRLDFALIRLSRRVGGEIGFLDVRNPPDANEDGALTVIGYPGGGSDCVSADHKVLSLEATSSRMRHGANTLEGMSGSPCLDDAGKVVALHEGAVTLPPPYNRAVHLRRIRDLIASKQPDPLSGDSGSVWAVRDADARRAWIAAGENALTDHTERDEWLRDVEAFDLRTQLGAASNDLFHPVFGRQSFQEWIDAAREADARQRIAFVTGRPLTGKSFSAFIAAAKLAHSGHQLIVVRPETLRAQPYAAVLNLVLDKTATISVAPGSGDVAVRPQAGAARRDVTPDVLDALEKLVKGRAAGSQQLWLLLDFGIDTNVTAETAPLWKEFLIQAAARPWLRVIVIGLRETRQREFAAALPTDVPFVEVIGEITLDDFQTSAERILQAVAPTKTLADMQGTIDTLWDSITERDARVIFAVGETLKLRAALAGA